MTAILSNVVEETILDNEMISDGILKGEMKPTPVRKT